MSRENNIIQIDLPDGSTNSYPNGKGFEDIWWIGKLIYFSTIDIPSVLPAYMSLCSQCVDNLSVNVL